MTPHDTGKDTEAAMAPTSKGLSYQQSPTLTGTLHCLLSPLVCSSSLILFRVITKNTRSGEADQASGGSTSRHSLVHLPGRGLAWPLYQTRPIDVDLHARCGANQVSQGRQGIEEGPLGCFLVDVRSVGLCGPRSSRPPISENSWSLVSDTTYSLPAEWPL